MPSEAKDWLACILEDRHEAPGDLSAVVSELPQYLFRELGSGRGATVLEFLLYRPGARQRADASLARAPSFGMIQPPASLESRCTAAANAIGTFNHIRSQ
jgi:hypothetical protein